MSKRKILSLMLALALLVGMMPAANADVTETWEKRDTIAPTCTTEGYELWVNFITGEEQHRNVQPALGHKFEGPITNWEKDPTCTEPGIGHQKCSRCGEDKVVEITPNGHTWGPWEITKEPTCTEEGSQMRYCRFQDVEETEAIPALGHAWGDWVTTAQPTCTASGT